MFYPQKNIKNNCAFNINYLALPNNLLNTHTHTHNTHRAYNIQNNHSTTQAIPTNFSLLFTQDLYNNNGTKSGCFSHCYAENSWTFFIYLTEPQGSYYSHFNT
jgi:hypothetical protein